MIHQTKDDIFVTCELNSSHKTLIKSIHVFKEMFNKFFAKCIPPCSLFTLKSYKVILQKFHNVWTGIKPKVSGFLQCSIIHDENINWLDEETNRKN
jgi:hypothetical protein